MISIVIRTLNEEQNLDRLLKILKYQTVESEIIVVDSGSTDGTVDIAKKHGAIITTCIPFTYGKALNVGIRLAKYEYICCLSAHCFPATDNFLRVMLNNLKTPKVVAVYSKQLPTDDSNILDRRNLFSIFRDEKIYQKRDPFFNNASSMFLRSVWEQTKFDEEISAWEDVKWAQDVLETSDSIVVYEPDAAVHHYHDESSEKTIIRYEKEWTSLEKEIRNKRRKIEDGRIRHY